MFQRCVASLRAASHAIGDEQTEQLKMESYMQLIGVAEGPRSCDNATFALFFLTSFFFDRLCAQRCALWPNHHQRSVSQALTSDHQAARRHGWNHWWREVCWFVAVWQCGKGQKGSPEGGGGFAAQCTIFCSSLPLIRPESLAKTTRWPPKLLGSSWCVARPALWRMVVLTWCCFLQK